MIYDFRTISGTYLSLSIDSSLAPKITPLGLGYRVLIRNCVFFLEFSKVCHLSLASTRLLLVVQKNYQPIGVTVHSHCIESFEGLYSDVGEGGVTVNCEKNTIFPEHPVQ